MRYLLAEGFEESPEALAERSRAFGQFYVSVIRKVTGLSEEEPSVPSQVADAAQHVLSSVKNHLSDQQEQLEGMSAKSLCEQISDPEKKQQLLEGNPDYILEEASTGMPVIYLPNSSFRKVYPTAQAVAAWIPQGVSFVLVPQMDDPAYMERQVEENLPHEIHHILWKFLQVDKIIEINEKNDNWAYAYAMFQDELIARLCSNGPLGGYSHVGPNEERVGEVADILDMVQECNELLERLEQFRNKTNVAKEDLIGSVAEARNFDELKRNLLKMEEFISQQSTIEQKEHPSSWEQV